MPTIPWNLTGTEAQKKIIQEGFSKIHFPFDQLKLPGTPELGWRDLNSGYYNTNAGELARNHEGSHEPASPADEGDEKAEPLFGELEDEQGRKFVMGVFYPYSARIYIDYRLERYPTYALATLSAEIAHAVDEFLPLTDEQRLAIMRALHNGEDCALHTWWEKQDYGREYYSLIGETFMILFTKAYSDIPFGDVSAFVHSGDNVTAMQIRHIIGINRTDDKEFIHYAGGPDIYHKPTHLYRNGKPLPIMASELTSAWRGCKVCKPKL